MCCAEAVREGGAEQVKEGWRPVNASRQIKEINYVEAFMKICCISFSFGIDRVSD